MKRQKEFTFNTVTDIKIFLMFLLDNIDRPIDYTTISEILMENVESLTIDYEDCLRQLADEGHLYFEEIDGDKYYKITSADHNLVRTHAQYRLLTSMESQYTAMRQIIHDLAKS